MSDDQFRSIDIPRWPQAVRVEWEREDCDDFDSSPRDYLFQDDDYRNEDQARLDAFNAGEWSFVGIRAKATIYVPIGGGSFVVHEMTSAGLWGVESDSGDDYFAEIFEDEKASLIDALAKIGEAAIVHRAIAHA